MAELLVRIVDKVNPDFYLNCGCTKRGHVIAAHPDGWAWGREERANPEWRILMVPDLSLNDVSVFLAPERNVNPRHPSRTLQRRAFKIDLDALPSTLTAAAVLAAKVPCPPIADPAVVGLGDPL